MVIPILNTPPRASRRPQERRYDLLRCRIATHRPWREHMSKKAAEHHKKASEHLTHAARHHVEAAKHHEAGKHETAAHHAQTATGHAVHARGHAEEAVKAHAEEHGKK